MSNIAIVLSAGSGKRMHSDVKKQYMMLCERELISYSLDVFEKSDIITDVILVVSAEDIEYCRENIVKKYGFSKVRSIIPGGRERYHSVMAGLDEIERLKDAGEIVSDGRDYVYIHDGARPFITQDMITQLH